MPSTTSQLLTSLPIPILESLGRPRLRSHCLPACLPSPCPTFPAEDFLRRAFGPQTGSTSIDMTRLPFAHLFLTTAAESGALCKPACPACRAMYLDPLKTASSDANGARSSGELPEPINTSWAATRAQKWRPRFTKFAFWRVCSCLEETQDCAGHWDVLDADEEAARELEGLARSRRLTEVEGAKPGCCDLGDSAAEVVAEMSLTKLQTMVRYGKQSALDNPAPAVKVAEMLLEMISPAYCARSSDRRHFALPAVSRSSLSLL